MAAANDDGFTMHACLGGLRSNIVDIDLSLVGKELNNLIIPAARVHAVEIGDLNVFGDPTKVTGDRTIAAPAGVMEAMRWGTKYFDARFYFMLQPARRPDVQAGTDCGKTDEQISAEVRTHLAWMALYLMLRGSYPSSVTKEAGRDVPKFLVDIFKTSLSPLGVAESLASFQLNKIDPRWIKEIDWSGAGAEFKQRLSLAVAGYRILGMFKVFRPKIDATEEEVAAYNWICNLARHPTDYNIMSATRSSTLIDRLGPWNKNLYSAIAQIFSVADIQEATALKILPAQANLDVRTNNWRTWPGTPLDFLNDPVKM
jgi:hypothetical protein